MRDAILRVGLIVAVAMILPACAAGSDGSGITPSDIPGEFRIAAQGGTGTNGDGGAGGYFTIRGSYVAGDVSLLTTGSVNAAVTIPNVVPALGSNPKTVDVDTTLTGVSESSTPFDGDLGGPATGLWVKPGVTLTLNPNDTGVSVDSGLPAVWLVFSAAIYIQGTVVLAPQGASPDTSNATIYCRDFVIASGGSFIYRGADNLAGGGATAGVIYVYASGTIVNLGTIDGRGGDGSTDGGDGNWIYLDTSNYYGGYGFFNGGTINTRGGNGAAGYGGDGGTIDLEGYRGCFNNGTLISTGGNGTTDGGSGGAIYLWSDNSVGACTHSGTADTSGGNSTDAGNGGGAGIFNAVAWSGSIRISAPITCRGGDGGPNGGNGGSGNYCYLHARQDASGLSTYPHPEGVFVGANIDLSGGTGEDGGDAGHLDVENYSYGFGRPTGVTLVGYTEINISGGNGTVNGGDADGPDSGSYVQASPCYDYYSYSYIGGAIYNEVALVARGGNGESGYGGYGSNLIFASDQTYNSALHASQGITNNGLISTYGGDGATDGGTGGTVDFSYQPNYYMGSAADLVNNATIDTHGGVGTSGSGGNGGHIVFNQTQTYTNLLPGTGIVNTGSLWAYGGSGASGGNGSYVYMFADFSVTSAGPITLDGGTGTVNDGGYGGWVYFTSTFPHPDPDSMYILSSAAISCVGGSGQVNGGGGNGIQMYSNGSVTITAPCTMTGGAGLAGGGYSGYFYVFANQNATITAPISTAGGGAGSGTGGYATGDGQMAIVALQVTLSRSINGRGGASTTGVGGQSYGIWIKSTEGGSHLAGCTLDMTGGIGGGGNGTDGAIYIDGIRLAGSTAGF